jgi:hypothetical protein
VGYPVTFRLALVPEPLEFAEDVFGTDSRPRLRSTIGVTAEIDRLALGMLWHPADAEQAREDILREAEELGVDVDDTESRAPLLGIAARHLLGRAPSHFERQRWTFEALAEDLLRGRDEPLPPTAFGEHSLALVEEVKLGCLQTMVLCVDRPHRIAYLLSTLDDMDPSTGALVLGIEAAEYRARAARAEELIRGFMESHCGLVNREKPCRCSRRLGRALITGRVDPDEFLFARHAN